MNEIKRTVVGPKRHKQGGRRREGEMKYLVAEDGLIATVTVVDRTSLDDAEGDADRHQQLNLCCHHFLLICAKSEKG